MNNKNYAGKGHVQFNKNVHLSYKQNTNFINRTAGSERQQIQCHEVISYILGFRTRIFQPYDSQFT